MKLRAVVIPSTTLLGPTDLADRIARGRVGTVIAPAAEAGKFGELAAGLRRITGAGRCRAGMAMRRAIPPPTTSRPTDRRRPAIRCCSISPRARRPRRSSCCTAMRILPSVISPPCIGWGWGRRMSISTSALPAGPSMPGCFFAPWNAGAAVFVYAASRFNAKETLSAIARHGRRPRAPPAAPAALRSGGSERFSFAPPGGGECGRTPQSRDHRDHPRGLEHRDPRRLRPNRDHGPDRQPAGPADQARIDGKAAARLSRGPPRYRRQGIGRGRGGPRPPRGPAGADAGL